MRSSCLSACAYVLLVHEYDILSSDGVLPPSLTLKRSRFGFVPDSNSNGAAASSSSCHHRLCLLLYCTCFENVEHIAHTCILLLPSFVSPSLPPSFVSPPDACSSSRLPRTAPTTALTRSRSADCAGVGTTSSLTFMLTSSVGWRGIKCRLGINKDRARDPKTKR